MNTGQKIKKYRKEKGLTQKELGLLCGFSDKSAEIRISQYENDSRIPRRETLELLAELLEVDVVKLIGFDINNELMAIQVLDDIKSVHGQKFIEAYLKSQKSSGETLEAQKINCDKSTLLNLLGKEIITVNYGFGDSVQLVPVNKILEIFS